MWYKKSSQIPCHYKSSISLIPTVSLSLSLPLTVSFSQATLFLRPSISSCLFSRQTSVFLVLFLVVLSFSFPLYRRFFFFMSVLSLLWHPPKGARGGLGIRVATSVFVDVRPGQLSSALFVSDEIWAGRKVQKSHQLVQSLAERFLFYRDAYIHVCPIILSNHHHLTFQYCLASTHVTCHLLLRVINDLASKFRYAKSSLCTVFPPP